MTFNLYYEAIHHQQLLVLVYFKSIKSIIVEIQQTWDEEYLVNGLDHNDRQKIYAPNT